MARRDGVRVDSRRGEGHTIFNQFVLRRSGREGGFGAKYSEKLPKKISCDVESHLWIFNEAAFGVGVGVIPCGCVGDIKANGDALLGDLLLDG